MYIDITSAKICLLLAMVVSWYITKKLIPYFRHKQLGQYIREEGPKDHMKKSGTPTMGGIAIVLGVIIGLLYGGIKNPDVWMIIINMILFGLIGFIDDYEKIAKKNNLGMTPMQKILLQVLFGVLIALYMIFFKEKGTLIFVPFIKQDVSLYIFFIPFIIFIEVAMSNAVNLTDGLDGLASSVTLSFSIILIAIGLLINESLFVISGASLAGALIGFLYFNWSPAKIFMGDTGSMALGGLISAIMIVRRLELLLPIIGIIYVIEALSVILQVAYFKKTGGKRLFRMSPIHHHFELGGMSEKKISILFSGVTFIFGILAYLSVKL